MQWYFLDFEIYNEYGRIMKWANQTIESDARPDEVLQAARRRVMDDLGLENISRVRARTFSKI
jgi:hypothetical protein